MRKIIIVVLALFMSPTVIDSASINSKNDRVIVFKKAKKKTSSSFGRFFSSLKLKFGKGNIKKRKSAVVGVRGSNVSEQEVSSLVKATDLYWAK